MFGKHLLVGGVEKERRKEAETTRGPSNIHTIFDIQRTASCDLQPSLSGQQRHGITGHVFQAGPLITPRYRVFQGKNSIHRLEQILFRIPAMKGRGGGVGGKRIVDSRARCFCITTEKENRARGRHIQYAV